MTFTGKIALVTGVTRGIGKAIALELGRQGAIIAGTATSQEGAEKIDKMLLDEKISGKGFVVDIADPAAIENAFTHISETFGAPQILVNNAGITNDNLFLRMKPDQWNSVINTDLNSLFYITKLCIKPMLKARWGRIINISSVVGTAGNPGQANYCAAKAGMIGFSKSLAQEFGSRGITVNCVAPGFIATDMTGELTDKQKEAINSAIPMQHIGEADDIAHTVVFLASEKARYITGQTIHVNGGMFMA
jgi:3-oxoacyl-[acyl-carrier protein] reductase